MASRRKEEYTRYGTYGNVAYAPAYERGTAVPRREKEAYPAPPRPKVRERTRPRVLEREQVQVRQAGQVAVFAVAGFLAVGMIAALLLLSYAQYAALTDQVVALRQEVSVLETERAGLSARYEQVFDMARIQTAVGDTMVRPSSDQVVYIDLSEPDSVVVFEEQGRLGGLEGFLRSGEEIFRDLAEYFR